MNNQNKIEGAKDIVLHPSLDINNGVVILGFRYKNAKRKPEDLFLITHNNRTSYITNTAFSTEGHSFFIEKNKRALAWLEERWGVERVNTFLNNPSSNSVSLDAVFREVSELTKDYVALEKDIDYLISTAWIIGTYFFPIFSAYPMLSIKGPKGSGKSQYLNVLGKFCFNAIKARPTFAALSDTVDALRGTYLIDQADSLNIKGNEQLLDSLTDSYKRGGGKRRLLNMDKGKRELVELEMYSPKAFASIRELPEDLRDRCLPIVLIKSQKNFRDPDDNSFDWSEMRGKLYRLLIDSYKLIGSHYAVAQVEYRQTAKISGRRLELWLPLEVILKCSGVGDKIIQEANTRFLNQYGFSEYEPSELDEAVIVALKDSFVAIEEQVLSPKDIAYLIKPEIFMAIDDDKQKAKKVGWTINNYNLATDKLKRSKEGVRYLFQKSKVEQIYNSYFNSEDLHTPSYTDTNKTVVAELPEVHNQSP